MEKIIQYIKFIMKTGRKPIQDDLDRAFCELAGEIGHSCCGFCEKCGKPKFMCICDYQDYLKGPLDPRD